MTEHPVAGLWSSRNFRLLWSGQTVGAVGSAITLIVIPLIALDALDASVSVTVALTGVSYLPTLLFGLLVGAWVDRRKKRPLMIFADCISAAALLSIPVANAFDRLTIIQLYAVALVLGAAQMVFQTADSALLPHLVPRQQLLAGNGALATSKSASLVGGPGIAGLIVQSVGAVGALLVSSLGFIASAAAVTFVRVREPPPVSRGRARSSLGREVADGLRYVYQDPILRILTVNAALANVALAGVEALFVPFLSRTVGFAPGAVGILIGLASAGGVLGAGVAATLARRLGSARSVLLSVLLCSPAGLLLPLTQDRFQPALFIVGGFVLLTGVGVYNVTVVSYRQASTPPQLLGRVTASMRVILLGAIPIGAALAAALTLAIGTRGALWVAVVLNLVPAVLLLTSPVRKLRSLPSLRQTDEHDGAPTRRPNNSV